MTDEARDLEQLRHLIGAEPPLGRCPPADTLARVAAGEATTEERDGVVDHLITCAHCSDEMRVATSLGGWAQRAGADLDGANDTRAIAPARRSYPLALAAAALLGVGLALAWALALRADNRRLAAQLEERTRPAAAAPAPTPSSDRSALEALQARLDQALMPTLNVPIVDLLPRDTTRGAATQTLARVPAGAGAATFIITPATTPAPRDHVLEIVGPSGNVLWRGQGLRANNEQTFTVTVPRARLATGICRVRLLVAGDDAGPAIAEYAVRVEP